MQREPKLPNNERNTEQNTEEFLHVKTRSSRGKEIGQAQGSNFNKVSETGNKKSEEQRINTSDEHEH